MTERAIILANECLRNLNGKTCHGLIRGPSRYEITAVVDPECAGLDAGEVMDGTGRGIPVHSSLSEAVAASEKDGTPTVCVVGVATEGGVLPASFREDLYEAARTGMTIISGLHQLLSEDGEISRLAEEGGGQIIDLRRPRPVSELHSWSGDVLDLKTPRVAVLGTDCALGKRTTCTLLQKEAKERGLGAEMIYTGQTGWLAGLKHGFILDATPNDFVSGELEHAVLRCNQEEEPDLIFLEGQSALRNPSGPCGAEFLVSADVKTVVLQHAPGRDFFDVIANRDIPIPSLDSEIELIRQYGAEVVAVTLNHDGLEPSRTEALSRDLRESLGVPVVFPLLDEGGISEVMDGLLSHLSLEPKA